MSDAGGREDAVAGYDKMCTTGGQEKNHPDLIRTGQPGTEELVGSACVRA